MNIRHSALALAIMATVGGGCVLFAAPALARSGAGAVNGVSGPGSVGQTGPNPSAGPSRPAGYGLATAKGAGNAAAQVDANGDSTTTQEERQKSKKKPAKKQKAKIQTLTGMTVHGFASSLSRAQEIKRLAPTVVDAISAEDATNLPYASVTEALESLPGVAASDFGVASDPDHFSIQGTDISLEGLPYLNTLFNGNTVFSAGGGEALNLFTVAPQLVSSVVVRKNQTAAMIPGGIAGSIDINTRKPFDSNKETQAALSVSTNYGTLSKDGTPDVSGLFSHIFNTQAGRFGILDNAAYDKINQTDNAFSLVDFQRRCAGCTLPGNRVDAFPGLQPGQFAYVPLGADMRVQNETSKRAGNVLVGQWESPNKAWTATLEWDYVADTETTAEHTLQVSTDGCAFSPIATCGIPLAGTAPVFNPDGVMETGIITAAPSPSSFGPLNFGGMQTQLDNAAFSNRYVTNNVTLNVGWNVNDRLHLKFGAQDLRTTNSYLYYYIRELTTANWYMHLNGFGVPNVHIVSPDSAESASQFYSNPANVLWNAAQDSHRDSSGIQHAYRFDGQFDIDQGILSDVKFGVRRSSQSQVVRNAAFNYVQLSSPFGQNAVTAADTPNFVSMFGMSLPAFGIRNEIYAPYLDVNPMTDFTTAVQQVRAINDKFREMNPTNPGGPYFTDWERAGLVPGSNGFLPDEISGNKETLSSGYVQFDFGNSGTSFLSGVQLAGNIGFHLVHTADDAQGFLTVPNQPQTMNGQSIAQFCRDQTAGTGGAQPGTFCALPTTQQEQYIKFANGGFTPVSAHNSYNNVLPSFNLLIGWTPNFLTRFAFSDAIYRPNLVQLAAGQSVGGLLPIGTNGSMVPTVQGGGGQNNPFLEPITSKNFDISQEWYFGKLGSLTGMIFYKRLNNVINNVTSFVDTTATNNGVTYPEQLVTGLANVKQESALTGAEVAYQQQFSFLPGWLSGFGVTANYTYIHQHGFGFGSPNFCPATYAAATQCINQLTLPPIELSRDNANFTLFYATPRISARLGYNWRSAFLITGFEADYPFVPVMSGPQGQLDGSFIYTINKHLKVAIQAANILDSTFKSREIINTSGLQVPKGFFRDDTRLNIGLRATF